MKPATSPYISCRPEHYPATSCRHRTRSARPRRRSLDHPASNATPTPSCPSWDRWEFCAEANLLTLDIYAFHQRFEIRWIALAVRFGLNSARSVKSLKWSIASRISHKSFRNVRPFSRVMVSRANGTAIVERTTRMAVAMINSRSVKPHSRFVGRLRYR